ncbi:MAG: XRE family transcriptional regulator [Pseudomonadota bacterium]
MTDDTEIQSFDFVSDAIHDPSEEAADMRLRSEPLMAVEQKVRSWGLTRAKAAERFGAAQPRLNDLLRWKTARFSLNALVELSARMARPEGRRR